MRIGLFFGFLFLFFFEASAGQWAFRARENYEFIKATESGQSFSGFSSTLNFGYEEPYKYYFSVGLNPGLVNFEEQDSRSLLPLGSKMRIHQLGSDIKYFPVEDLKGFVRSTLFYALVDTKTNVDNIGGYGLSASVGWEFWMYDLFSLAPEVGYKHTRLRTGENLNAVFFSIGVHFYKFAVKEIE
jgi:hypothetical protein